MNLRKGEILYFYLPFNIQRLTAAHILVYAIVMNLCVCVPTPD